MIKLCPALEKSFPAADAFDRILQLEGEVYRQLAGRRTLRFFLDGEPYFIKIHMGVGWREIIKNLTHGRLPVLGAGNEWRAIQRFEELEVPTMTLAGYGERGWNPACIESFVITEELQDTVSLEDLCRNWASEPPRPEAKRVLIETVANIARRLHENGVNHRDFYLCHFLLDRTQAEQLSRLAPPQLHVIDLHRVQLRRRTPQRWIIKDLAGLFFSSLDIGLTSRDCFRFLRHYRGTSLREVMGHEERFWRRVCRRAVRLYQRDFDKMPVLPVAFANRADKRG